MCKVLVVDDDELVRNSTSAMLISLRHVVVEAKDGSEAVLVYTAMGDEISIVIMDIKMPKMDGIEATKLIRQFNPRARVILMSGFAEKIPSNVKPSAFIAKPFTRLELGDIIQLVLKSAS